VTSTLKQSTVHFYTNNQNNHASHHAKMTIYWYVIELEATVTPRWHQVNLVQLKIKWLHTWLV